MCLICAQIYSPDKWSHNPRDKESTRVAGGEAALNRHQEGARRLRIINEIVQPFRLYVKNDISGGYAISDAKGKTTVASGLDDLWYKLESDFNCRIDMLAL